MYPTTPFLSETSSFEGFQKPSLVHHVIGLKKVQFEHHGWGFVLSTVLDNLLCKNYPLEDGPARYEAILLVPDKRTQNLTNPISWDLGYDFHRPI